MHGMQNFTKQPSKLNLNYKFENRQSITSSYIWLRKSMKYLKFHKFNQIYLYQKPENDIKGYIKSDESYIRMFISTIAENWNA